jgi:predicted MFS family arabinose efflux permease
VLLAIGLLAACTFVLPWTVVALPLALAVFAIWAFGTWFGIPGQQTIVAALAGDLRGTYLAFNGSALNLGGVFGPIATGQAITFGGFDLAARWTSAVALVALAIAWFALPSRLPESATDEELDAALVTRPAAEPPV